MMTLTPGPIVAPGAVEPIANPLIRAGGNGTAPAGAAPMTGASAVTAATQTRDPALSERSDNSADRIEPPQDPAPLKGLGIPPLNMERVGDGDEVPTPPDVEAEVIPAIADSLEALLPPATPTVDYRA